MHADSKTAIALEIERYWAERRYGHAAAVAEVLERLPNGEYAWLRSSSESEDARYTITDAGRRALREADCFGPWPTVAQASMAALP